MTELQDDSIMPYGKYKGTKMANVPARYLMYLYENKKCDFRVKNYILYNFDVLQAEIQAKKK